METLGAARLAKEIPAQRAVGTTVPRDDIAAVLQDPDSEPELFLRMAGDGFEADDGNVIGMTWSRDDLEELLGSTAGEDVMLTFDRDELRGALFADVEAHGLRERAAVFTVVAAGALGTGAAIANAMPTGDDGGPVATQVAPAAPAGNLVTDASSAAGYVTAAGQADNLVTDASSGGGYVPASAGDSIVTDASSAAGYTAPAPTDSSAGSLRSDASLSGGYGPAPTTDTSGGGVLSIHAPSPADGLAAGAILLAIAGATFASRRHPGASRPA